MRWIYHIADTAQVCNLAKWPFLNCSTRFSLYLLIFRDSQFLHRKKLNSHRHLSLGEHGYVSKWAVSRGEQELLINLEMYCSKLIKLEADGEMGGAFFCFFFLFSCVHSQIFPFSAHPAALVRLPAVGSSVSCRNPEAAVGAGPCQARSYQNDLKFS